MSARDTIVRGIVRGLYDGQHLPGQRMSEARLTADYGTSRGPVREALNALAAMGIVELAPERGAQVRVLETSEAIDTLIVAQTLIGLAARLAALRCAADPQGRARLQTALETLASFAAAGGKADFALARDGFYGAINALAANDELRRILPTVRIHLIRVQFRNVLETDGRVDDYREITEAILAGLPRPAETAARAHLQRAIKRLEASKPS